MYAIRSYYVFLITKFYKGIIILIISLYKVILFIFKKIFRLIKKLFVCFKNRKNISYKGEHLLLKNQDEHIDLTEENVITSYSIHYTKLYDVSRTLQAKKISSNRQPVRQSIL